eukprot:Opistho-2@79146
MCSCGVFSKLLLVVLVMLNWGACGWYALACPGGAGTECGTTHAHSWTVATTIANASSLPFPKWPMMHQYEAALYWSAATFTNAGYGDIVATNDDERWYSIAAMLVGCTAFGYLSGIIASTIANAQAHKMAFVLQLEAVRRYLDTHVEPKVAALVVSYYKYLWRRNRGEETNKLFGALPTSFRTEISLGMYTKFIDAIPLLRVTPMPFKRMLSLECRHMLYTAGVYVLRAGESKTDLYYIQRGELEALNANGTSIFRTLTAGNYFGADTFFSGGEGPPSTYSVRTRTNCEIFMLSKESLNKVAEHYPETKCEIAEGYASSDPSRPINERFGRQGRISANYTEAMAAVEKLRQMHEGGRIRSMSVTSSAPVEVETAAAVNVGVSMQVALIWENAIVVASLVAAFLFPYQAAFAHTSTVLYVLTYALDVMFIVDVIAQMTRADVALAGIQSAEMQRARQVKAVLSSGTVAVDLVASFPTDVFCLIASRGYSRLWLLSYLRLNRVLRFHDVTGFFTRMGRHLSLKWVWIRLLRFCIYIVLMAHVCACVFYIAACGGESGCKMPSWIDEEEGPIGRATIVQYVASLYWSVSTLTLTGLGDLHCVTAGEMAVGILTFLAATLIIGVSTGSITAHLANESLQSVKLRQKLRAIRRFMKEHDIDPELQAKTVQYYETQWQDAHVTDPRRLFDHLPQKIQGKVSKSLSRSASNASRRGSLTQSLRSPTSVDTQSNPLSSNPCSQVTSTERLPSEGQGPYGRSRLPSIQLHKFDIQEVAEEGDMSKMEGAAPKQRKPSVAVRTKQALAALLSRVPVSSPVGLRGWQLVVVAAAVVCSITIAFQAAFAPADMYGLLALNYALDALFVANLVIVARTSSLSRVKEDAHLDSDAYRESADSTGNRDSLSGIRPTKAFQQAVDIASCLPIEIFCLAAPASIRPVVLRYMQLNRLLRFGIVQRYFNRAAAQINSTTERMEIVHFAVSVAVFLNWAACLLLVIACDTRLDGECDSLSWVAAQNMEDASVGRKYVAALYYATSAVTCVGYGDFFAVTVGERIYLMLLMLGGVLMFGYIIGSIAAALATSGLQRSQYQAKISAVANYMKHAKVDAGIQYRVVRYYEYLWERTRGVDANSLFSELPTELQADLCYSVHADIVNKVPIFLDTELEFKRKLSMRMKPIVIRMREYVVRKGDVGSEMYFIHRGMVQVISEDNPPKVYAEMGAGAFFR